jgi:transcriptional regulator with XRE-family HTH domain
MMNGEPAKGIEDIVRRNVAALRSKANLTQQGLADQMLLRGVPWTRETVAQVETTNRRLGFAEAIAVAACLDVPVARLTATGAVAVGVGESEWTAAYLGAAIAGTAGDIFPPEAYATRGRPAAETGPPVHRAPEVSEPLSPIPPGAPVARPGVAEPNPPTRLFASITTDEDQSTGRRGPAERRSAEAGGTELPGRRSTDPRTPEPSPTLRPAPEPSPTLRPAPEPDLGSSPEDEPGAAPAPQRAAERIERRMRLRVTASDVDATAQHLWSRSLESERERRVTDRHALTGGSLKTIRGHVSRDLDREIAHEMGRRPDDDDPPTEDTTEGAEPLALSPDEAAWEATRLNIILANKGYSDSDVTRWWNFTRHRELNDLTIAEAWKSGSYDAVIALIESLPDQHGATSGYYPAE